MKNRLYQPFLRDVKVTDGFWKQKMDINQKNTLPIQYKQCLETGRIDALKLKWKEGMQNKPHIFWDSDIGKWIEAAAYSLVNYPDNSIEEKIDYIIELIDKAQMPDGYFNSYFQSCDIEGRWKNLRDNHELYCAGHLIEGAVAYFYATGKVKFLRIVEKFADHIASQFGREEVKRRGYCGHEEIELALIKLFRVTNNKKYLNLAKYFVDERGSLPYYFDIEAKDRGEDPKKFWANSYEYCQAHLPVRQQKKVVGHAVRAMYLYCAMTDLAVETDDKQLLNACNILWNDLVTKKMHVTGGIGQTHANEGFTTDYDLPNESAYLETCASIGLFLWAYRMFNASLDSKYSNIMELALYNGIASGVSIDGKRFLYGNPLAVHPGFNGNGQYCGENFHYQRSDWFSCACCPPNIARLYASLPSYIYSLSKDALFLHIYTDSELMFKLAEKTIQIIQKTKMPWEGRILIQIIPETELYFKFYLRIPDWAGKFSIKINGKKAKILESKEVPGYIKISKQWKKGDNIELSIEMPIIQLEAHPAARQNCGKIAIKRGPFIYCLEEIDNGKNLNDICLLRKSQFTAKKIRDKKIGNFIAIFANSIKRSEKKWKNKLYSKEPSTLEKRKVMAIPYAFWGNRKAGEMITWIRAE
ncbi:MAG TPA: glycoside hydrolase family 127 protein [Victivallales bacterium]|nr:glycoside hydrolase family 127 protein [Victivallales bacterium]